MFMWGMLLNSLKTEFAADTCTALNLLSYTVSDSHPLKVSLIGM